MASTTGIELGPDTCVLAGVRATRSGAEILGVHTIEPAAWPAHDRALAEMLRGVRTTRKLPRRARVVAWGLQDDSSNEAMARAAMRPLIAAGFRVDRILTPPQALGVLASTRVKPGVQTSGVVWLALNMHGAAIAIVRGGELLFARTFQWAYNPHLLESKAQLLQRYSLISHLAPEVRRGIAAVRASHGIPVDAIVTCGDLPELRSLTMPLIEELDLEVETLDSLEGLRPVGRARLEPLAESAPAIRLACAAALAGAERERAGLPPAIGIAAAAALVAALGYGAYAYFTRALTPAPPPRTVQVISKPAAKQPSHTTSGPASRAAMNTPAAPPKAVSPKPMTQAELAKAEPKVVSPRPTRQAGLAKAEAKTEAKPVLPPAAKTPAQTVAKPVSPMPAPRAALPKPATESAPPPPRQPAQTAATVEPPRRAPEPSMKTQVPTKPDLAVGSQAERGTTIPADTRGVVFPRQAPLKEPLPKVDSILIDQERRLAILDGAVVAVGDRVGSRVITRIERDSVILREPSGLTVTVSVRPR